ncbi:hypothetical protein CR513_24478, partial [Mucuna pruriens]
MKRGYSVAVAFSAIYVIMFFLCLSYSIKVEGVRHLKHESPHSSFITLIINRAYSGPSHRGRGESS